MSLGLVTTAFAILTSAGVSTSSVPVATPAPLPFAQSSQPRGDDSVTIVVTPEQEAAVERGLAYLASTQSPDGSWV
jgi:hypothetical protein